MKIPTVYLQHRSSTKSLYQCSEFPSPSSSIIRAGEMVHTNEVHVHLSSSITVNTSTKHAKSILQRRRDYTVDKQDMLQQQLDSLRSRRAFAKSEKVQGEV